MSVPRRAGRPVMGRRVCETDGPLFFCLEACYLEYLLDKLTNLRNCFPTVTSRGVYQLFAVKQGGKVYDSV